MYPGHTIEMTAASATPDADRCLVDGDGDGWTDAALMSHIGHEWTTTC